MKKATSLAVLSLVLFVGCATHQAALQPDRSPLWRAQMAFTGASIDYEAVMNSAQELRAAGKITDAQWKNIDALQIVVARYAQIAHTLLEQWQESGLKPEGYDAAFANVEASVIRAKSIVYGGAN